MSTLKMLIYIGTVMIRNNSKKDHAAHLGLPQDHETAGYSDTVYCVSLFSTAVDCGSLPDPANGRVDHTAGTSLGQTAIYSCNTGYNLVGDSTRTCQATRIWSGSAPTCQGMLLLT